MVHVRQDDLGAGGLQVLPAKRLDGAAGGHRHKKRRLDLAVGCSQNAPTGLSGGIVCFNAEILHNYLINMQSP